MATSPSFSRPATARGPAVAFEGVGKTYGGTVAIAGVDATILPGTFIAIVGSSGSGKSTVLKAVNRLIEPDAGAVRIDGRDVQDQELHQLRRSIGYVFQNIGLFPHMSVAQNIGIGSRIASRKPLAGERIAALLDLVDLPRDFASRLPEQLSGGQKQRVGVARALASEPGLMLMDEPFGALDPVTREALGEQYRALHDRLGLTTIMVTHDMAEALLFADRIWVMARGRIVADATPAELIAGRCGPEAEALVAVPRLQAERITAMRAAGATA
jgi:osmoprotectant transport system ATP-binding protein